MGKFYVKYILIKYLEDCLMRFNWVDFLRMNVFDWLKIIKKII